MTMEIPVSFLILTEKAIKFFMNTNIFPAWFKYFAMKIQNTIKDFNLYL